MPYFLRKYPKGWKVVDDKGHFYSKRFLGKQRAVAQMKALYANTTHTGKGYTIYQMGGNTHYVMHGKGRFTEWIKKGVKKVGEFAKKLVAPGLKAVRDLTSPLTRQNAFPPKVRQFIEQNKTCLVKSAYVRRFPIYAVLEKVLNFISANRFGEIKRSLGYDDMFHLSLVVGLQCSDGRKFGVMIEKNEVVNITTEYKDDGAGTQLLTVPVPVAIPFGSFIQKAVDAIGPSIYQYDAFNNNCQIFVRNILQANGLLNPEVSAFVMQDSLSLVQQLPDYVGPFARVVTNIAGIADRFIEGEGKPDLVGSGFFDDVGDWFKTTFTGQRDTYPLQPLYDVIELIGPAPLAGDYGFNESEMSRGQTIQAIQSLQTGDYRKIEDAVFDRRRDTENRLKREGMKGFALTKELQRLSHTDPYYRDWKTKEEFCFYETQSAKASGIGNSIKRAPPPECSASDNIKPKEGESYDTARQFGNLCAWLKTPEGGQYKMAVQQWNANKKSVEEANLEIVKNNELIEAENAKIRDCNESVGCSLKTALGSLTDVVSWIPGPIGTVAGLANTGLSFIGDGKPKRGGRRLPPMPDLTMEQFEGMYGKAPTRDQYPAGPEGDKKYKEVIDRRQQLYEGRKKGISPANPTTADFVAKGQKIVEMQDKRKADYIAEQQRITKSFPDIVLPQCGPAPDRTEEYRSAGVGALAFGLAQRGRGKSCCGKCVKRNDGSCKMKGGCGACGSATKSPNAYSGGSNGVMKGKGNTQSKPTGKGAIKKLPFPKAEYLKKVRERANSAGYDGRAIEFSDKPAKKFMIYDDKGKKHYFGANTYGDYIIWSAIDKEKAEQKRKAYLARATKIKGNWASDKFSPNSLAVKILWGGN